MGMEVSAVLVVVARQYQIMAPITKTINNRKSIESDKIIIDY